MFLTLLSDDMHKNPEASESSKQVRSRTSSLNGELEFQNSDDYVTRQVTWEATVVAVMREAVRVGPSALGIRTPFLFSARQVIHDACRVGRQ